MGPVCVGAAVAVERARACICASRYFIASIVIVVGGSSDSGGGGDVVVVVAIAATAAAVNISQDEFYVLRGL